MQLSIEEVETLAPMRVIEVHRDRVVAMDETQTRQLALPGDLNAGDIAVGDWLLAEPGPGRVARVLERRSVLSRRASGHRIRNQLIAANLNTLLVVTSCNADFSLPRLERYAALALEGDCDPIFIITKPDLIEDPAPYLAKAQSVIQNAIAMTLNARDHAAVQEALGPWCGAGQTVALAGSSGVGKSTLAEALTGEKLETADARSADAKGRHTTTARSLMPMLTGGWLIDTPGMRELGMQDAASGIDVVFAEFAELAAQCKFRDCAHEGEPGCAIGAAIEAGTLDAGRLQRWKKLRLEDAHNSASLAEARARDKAFGKVIRSTQAHSKRRKGRPG
ncbi:ribosome small subunit-dependent GTPase A [Alphaproteobacteria bacterium KMM 3653]|uniref:Small ribosomal subunit biogenesis GTPase RsgA n=2 Tax=Harenicola maris TaxID=2841044 RepID=A0AAP2CQZ3_9RHOB|nr:ribosome small subunit-dependent GTPase A [Harenicola maris]